MRLHDTLYLNSATLFVLSSRTHRSPAVFLSDYQSPVISASGRPAAKRHDSQSADGCVRIHDRSRFRFVVLRVAIAGCTAISRTSADQRRTAGSQWNHGRSLRRLMGRRKHGPCRKRADGKFSDAGSGGVNVDGPSSATGLYHLDRNRRRDWDGLSPMVSHLSGMGCRTGW